MKICGICLKEIKKNENYIRATLFEKEIETETKYAHVSCWKVEFDQKKIIKNSLSILKGAQQFMQEKGIIPPKVVDLI